MYLCALNYSQQAKIAKTRDNQMKQSCRDRCTLCYFTTRTDGSHTPQSLLEGCVYMEAAVPIGQMLQEEKNRRLNHTQDIPLSECKAVQ